MLDEELRKALVQLRRIEDAYEKTGKVFEDPDFPPYACADAPRWLRPGQLERHDGRRLERDEDWQLFRGRPCSEDVQQGKLGDCWFLGALAALAEFREGRFVRELLPKQRHRSRAGAYAVRLCLGGRWRAVLVDDRLPCRQLAVGEATEDQEQAWALAFCRTGRLQLWASLLEKGLAKLCGSYEATAGGLAGDAFPMITGWPCTVLGLGVPDELPTWDLLSELLAGRFLIGCSSRDGVERDGLQAEHVYTLLDAVEVAAQGGENSRLLKLRDPQKSSDWCGRWSDSSPCWTPELRAQFGCEPGSGQDTGLIFLSLEDFFARFSQLSVCEARSSEWSEQQIPLTPSNGSCQGLLVEAAVAMECVVSLCLPYEHALACKPTSWLVLLRVQGAPPSAAATSVALVARTRFARESTVSIEFAFHAKEVFILVPFCIVPGKDRDGEGCSGAAPDGTWACFSREPLRRCEVCRLSWEGFKSLEDASAASYHWQDRGPRGISGDAPPWGETFDLRLAEDPKKAS